MKGECEKKKLKKERRMLWVLGDDLLLRLIRKMGKK